MSKIGAWAKSIGDYPGFREWKAKHISATLSYGDPFFGRDKNDELSRQEFTFPPHIEKQHAAVMSYLSLCMTYQALADTEFYFRRYPFSNLRVSHDSHLRYVCEMFFSRVYEFSERLKKCLNLVNQVVPQQVEVGRLIKTFGKDFSKELRNRNLVHHHDRFDDIVIEKIGLLAVMADNHSKDSGWKQEHKNTYRAASKEWAERARRRAARAHDYVEAVAMLMSEQCAFLDDPLTVEPH